jgi:hypothetical protein
MFYKKTDEGDWYTGNAVHFPDGVILNKDNKVSHDGWEWHEEPPQEYLDWIDSVKINSTRYE